MEMNCKSSIWNFVGQLLIAEITAFSTACLPVFPWDMHYCVIVALVVGLGIGYLMHKLDVSRLWPIITATCLVFLAITTQIPTVSLKIAELTHGAKVAGRVVDSTGKPCAQLAVSIFSRDEPSVARGCLTDCDGVFLQNNLTPGVCDILVLKRMTNEIQLLASTAMAESQTPDRYREYTFVACNTQLRGEATLYFEQEGEHQLTDTVRFQLRQIIQAPSSRRTVFFVQAHCSVSGSSRHNYVLGAKRAQAVKDFLISNGISRRRIWCVSYGETNPADCDLGPVADQRNRRAEIVCFDTDLNCDLFTSSGKSALPMAFLLPHWL